MEDLIIGQNTSVPYRIYITHSNKQLVLEDIKRLEVMFGKVRKVYSAEQADENFYYYPTDGCWYITLTEKDTSNFRDNIPVQVRVQFVDGTIQTSCIQYVPIQKTLSNIPIEDETPDEEDTTLDHDCLPLTAAPAVCSVRKYMKQR